MKKRRKDENNRGFVTVHPSMFPETSFIQMKAELRQEIFNFDGEEKMYDEEKMTDDEYKMAKDKNHKMMWFAKGLLSSEKKRKMFCKLKDPEAKREWIESEMAKE
ncbi:PREDICTED: uncharacterized protein LOC103337823 [Prunus mume]|uniref:Uncharacterized protein LOC103337823 n=1 Tax=Prunus mume TaxID=102107 RepID=A0ABM0PG92_PRUMU|nr:PREDICTED: uncharacterized protein LOC103337823 [Prunus mume]